MSSKLGREMHQIDTVELERRLLEAHNDLIGIRFGVATRQTQNTARIVHAKRQIARIKTILSERQLEEV